MNIHSDQHIIINILINGQFVLNSRFILVIQISGVLFNDFGRARFPEGLLRR